jgi:apolipoprotein N-acyltransferase
MRSAWKLWAAAVLSAGLLELPFPLAGPMPPWRSLLAFIALVPLLWAIVAPAPEIDRHPLRRVFLVAYLCGVLWYLGNCYWIYSTMLIYGGLPPALAFLVLLLFSLVLGLYFGLFGLGIALARRATGSIRLALAFAPFLWVALELAGARVTSVPWDQLGYSQVDNGLLTRIAPWEGVYGISFVLVVVNALFAGALRLPAKSSPASTSPGASKSSFAGRWAWAACGAFLFVVGAGGLLIEAPENPAHATAVLVQPNLDVGDANTWPGAEWNNHIAEFIRLGSQSCGPYLNGIPQTGAPGTDPACTAPLPHPDLVVWPEAPAPFFEPDMRFQHAMADVARAEQAPLIINGVGTDPPQADGEWHDHVSAMVFNADGSEAGRYDKIHLVPWGEYIPFPKLFFFAHKITGKVSSFTPGTARSVFLLRTQNGQSHRYGIFICYESVFADEIRQFALRGAEVFVNASDDGWYGDTSAPWQHLNMARMRAIENRRWILRDTNTGVTSVIDPEGRVQQSIPRHQIGALAARFGFRYANTFYTVHGDLFAWLCAALAFGVLVWAAGRRLRK